MWVKHEVDNRLPDWLKDNIKSTCEFCKSEMENFYNEEQGRCTNRRCSNIRCPSIMAKKAAFIKKTFTNSKGVDYKTYLNSCTPSTLNHIQLFNSLREENLKLTFPELGRALCIPKFDTSISKLISDKGIETKEQLVDLLDKLGVFDNIDRDYVLQCIDDAETREQEFLEAASEVGVYKFTIMITGVPHGYATKEDYVKFLNNKFQGYIYVAHQVTPKKSGIDGVIQVPGTNHKTKINIAKQCNIPIFNPENFIMFLEKVKEHYIKEYIFSRKEV